MRKHGKVAVLKDDEVDRLERKTATMSDMYGKNQPKPLPPSYTPEELRLMRAAEERSLLEDVVGTKAEQLWGEIRVPDDMGLECSKYKWRQNQSFVEIFVQLPASVSAKAVSVELTSNFLSVTVGGEVLMKGDLFLPIKQDMSTWLINDNILEMVLLKRYRKGHYEDGKTNSDTFWFGIFRKGRPEESIELEHPPSKYYSSHWEKEEHRPMSKIMGKSSNRPMIDRSRER